MRLAASVAGVPNAQRQKGIAKKLVLLLADSPMFYAPIPFMERGYPKKLSVGGVHTPSIFPKTHKKHWDTWLE